MAVNANDPNFKRLIEAFLAGKDAPPHNHMFVRSTDTASILFDYGEHFPMARRVHGVVLFTTRKAWGRGNDGKNSATTEDHKRCALAVIRSRRDANGNTRRIFHVYDVLAQTPDEHEWNADDYQRRIQALETKAEKARKYAEYHARDMIALLEEAEDYCKHFKVWSDARSNTFRYLRASANTMLR